MLCSDELKCCDSFALKKCSGTCFWVLREISSGGMSLVQHIVGIMCHDVLGTGLRISFDDISLC